MIEGTRMTELTYNVLFLCTGNTARSILAEGILRKEGAGHFNAFSAGSQPKGVVNAYAVKTLAAYGYPAENFRSKAGTNMPRPARRSWISSSPFAIARRAKCAQSGRGSP